MRYLEDGFVLKYVDVNANGRVDIEHLASLMNVRSALFLVCM